MEANTKVVTETNYSDGKFLTGFAGHSPLNIAGLSGIENLPQTWSPPHLFVAAVETCFLVTLIAVAKKMRIEVLGLSPVSEGNIISSDGRHYEVNEIIIRPKFDLKNEDDKNKLPQLIKMAKEHCLVARSLKTEVKCEI